MPSIVLEYIYAMKTSQHRNGLKSEFRFVSFFFKNYRKSLKNWKVLGISKYFGSISAIFTFDLFPFFLGYVSSFLGSVFGFQKSFKSSVCWSVLSFIGSVSSFFGVRFRSQKRFKFSVCWSVSSFFWVCFRFSERKSSKFLVCWWVSSFFGSVFGFQKKF